MTLNRRTLLSLAAALPLLSPAARAADAWPNRPIKWIVAYPAGGGSDFLARQLAPQLGKQLGTTLIIDNKPGAAGIIGTDAAAKSPADGYTILTGDNGAMVFHTAMYRKLPYDPKDFTPLGFMARFPLILVAHPDAPFKDARQWLDAVKQNPGKFTYASPGAGSPHHLAMELIKERTGSFIVHVPYRGTAPALQDVISGQVPMMIVDTAGGLTQIRGGKVKALAVLSAKRIPQLPDVPTLAEAGADRGLKGFEAPAWQGFFVPRGTPAEIALRLSAEMQKALAVPEVRARLGTEMRAAILAPDVKARLEEFGLEVAPTDGPALAAFIQKETVFWHKLIADRKLSLD